MAEEIATSKKLFLNAKKNGCHNVIDFKEKLQDFDCTLTGLHRGKYRMDTMESDCAIKKFDVDRTKASTFSLIKNVRHTNIVTVRNFYDEVGQPRFVLSWVDGSLTAWVKSEGAKMLFKKSWTGRSPTPTFRQIVIDLCAGLEHLFEEGIYPIRIGVEDMFVRKAGRKPSVQLLITKAKSFVESDKVGSKNIQNGLWKQMRDAIKDIFKDHLDSQNSNDSVLSRFFEHIAEGGAKKLQNYPLDWSEEDKAKYLLKIIAIDKSEVQQKLSKVNIVWPPETVSGKLPSPLREMKVHEMTRAHPASYDVKIPYDYLKICKNMIKHWWVLPEDVKAECSTWKRLVEKMDTWDPLLWCKLYDLFG